MMELIKKHTMNKLTSLSAIVLTLLGSWQLSFADRPRPQAELYDAAYSGDIDYLRKTYGDAQGDKSKWPAAPSELVGEALAGHQYEIVRWCANADPDANKLSGWFGCKQMDVKAAKIIFDQVPGLKTNFVNKTLDGVILMDNPELLKWLLDSGMKPTNDRMAPAPLLVATQLRRMESISLLLQHGADPYQVSPDGLSPVGMAVAFESSSLLKLLDKDKKYAAELAKFEQELLPPKDTPFVGTWAHLQEGFGSMSITLYADGTGNVGADFGGMSCIWKQSGETAKLTLMYDQLVERTKPANKETVDIKIDGDTLAVIMGGQNLQLKKFDAKAPSEKSVARRPLYLRVEKACISPANDLFIQINGRFIKVSIAHLTSGQEPADDFAKKMFRWSEFQKGQIPLSILTNSMEVPFVDNHTDGYFPDKLAFDFTHDAELKAGSDFTFFPYGSNNYYHGPDTDQYGELVNGFALLSNKPFANDKNWLLLFVLKTKSYDLPSPSPW